MFADEEHEGPFSPTISSLDRRTSLPLLRKDENPFPSPSFCDLLNVEVGFFAVKFSKRMLLENELVLAKS